ncbi:MAG: hypothetical protein LBH09_05615 [Peptococcaceae bacterium]|jgi:hypothetical protein|nr:hypothetical protein [Peptococcaceae bacterium]
MYYGVRGKKSFLQSFTWVGFFLLAMGVIFLAIATTMQMIPMDVSDVHMYRNGLEMPATLESLKTFRLIFLLAFGIPGLVLLIIGGIVTMRGGAQRSLSRRLKEEGEHLIAEVTSPIPTNVSVNHRALMRLQCAYLDADGTTFLFKSGILRADPTPFLNQGQVDVYYDRRDMSRYFVDVDGSAEMNTKVIEL